MKHIDYQRFTVWAMIGLILLSYVFSQCKKEDHSQDIKPFPEHFLTLYDSLIKATSSAGSRVIVLQSNLSWSIENSAQWLTVTPSSGTGNSSITLSWEGNPDSLERSAALQFKANEITKEITVLQKGLFRLVSTGIVLGINNLGYPDSILLRFNKPVKVNFITSSWVYCFSEIIYEYMEEDYAVRFTYKCAGIGGSYPIEYSVTGPDGDTLTGSTEVTFCSKKIALDGVISEFFLSEDNKTCWVVTKYPNRILSISTADLTINSESPIPVVPGKCRINPYNGLFYVVVNDSPYNPLYDEHVYVFSPLTGDLVKSFAFTPDSLDHPQHPAIYPYDIGFTASGYGVVFLRAKGSTAQRWKIIDAANEDSISIHPDWNQLFFRMFEKVYPTFDFQKLLLLDANGGNGISVLDGMSHELTHLFPPVGDRGNYLVPNRTNSKVYLGQLTKQFIWDLDTWEASQVSLFSPNGASADFTYQPGFESLMYYCDENHLLICDYATAQNEFLTDASNGMEQLTSSTNGDFFIMFKNTPSGQSSDLFLFSKTLFE